MAGQRRRQGGGTGEPLPVEDFRHNGATRPNNPPAALAAEGRTPTVPRQSYAYSPRLDPVLRSDPTGRADALPPLLEKATREILTPEEAALLAEALRRQEPWLEWAGKRETPGFAVDPVALHIHERVSTQAILRAAARRDVTRDLFADPALPYAQAVKFYQHDMDWANRLILGDSLQVMASLAQRENFAGKVQMIYLDPPYGIRFGSNFQPETGKRSVTDREVDLTREPEMVRAYRDTWRLGVHSYLAYLRDRLIVARTLLRETGSIFVQIGDENVHRVRTLMDEVFGSESTVSTITIQKTGGATSEQIPNTLDYLLWYAKNKAELRYNQLFRLKEVGIGHGSGARYDQTDDSGRSFQLTSLTSQRPPGSFEVAFQGKAWLPSGGFWKTGIEGFRRIIGAERVRKAGSTLRYVRYLEDFPAYPITNLWSDTAGSPDKVYVVQTSPLIVQRCILMTTEPGDLVIDPTCGSGTTAVIAEQWGRRWITIDTSRVAVAIARQRLLTGICSTR
jgi:adenine-specific DNA-methyltransferase